MIQKQYPERAVFIAGDKVVFRLSDIPETAGHAFVRTTIGGVDALRSEKIAENENGITPHGLAWRDIPMVRDAGGSFSLELVLIDIGVFEAKCGFAPADGSRIIWPEGGNFRLKVESASNLCGNSIYCAFVRQFDRERPPAPGNCEAMEKTLDEQGYTVIPPSGTFRSLIGKLDHIFGTLGCRILQLLPIHPVPTVYARMGRYGSPFASLDYFAVDPALAEFDRTATPMEQFLELVDAVHARDGRILLDIPVNHTGWASQLQNEHPEYFVRHGDGTFESPGAWGVVWADLCKLNYQDAGVARLMADVFLHWCRLGVDGFRCDAGYMLPEKAWDYIAAKVRSEYPDTVFLLEGLGGPVPVQERLLSRSGLDWAYSELFQNYSRDEISRYQPYMESCGRSFGTLVNFAETHDNLRLAAQSPAYAAMRCSLCALLSGGGAFGFTNGVEFLASEKIDVHGKGSLNWGAEVNIIPLLRRLNKLLSCHPVFFAGASVRLIQHGPGNLVAALRESDCGRKLLVLVNLDTENSAQAHWPKRFFEAERAFDLLHDREALIVCRNEDAMTSLAPGEALCLTLDPSERFLLNDCGGEPDAVTERRAWVMANMVWRHFRRSGIPGGDAGAVLRRNPMEFCRTVSGEALPGVTGYHAAKDLNRMVMLPPGDLMLFENPSSFRVEICLGKKVLAAGRSISRIDAGGEFTLLALPENTDTSCRELTVRVTVFDPVAGNLRREGRMLLLSGGGMVPPFKMRYTAAEVAAGNIHAFCANDRGGMTLTGGAWGRLESKYDALLAANGPAEFPVDRRVMFTRLRGWLVVEEYSQELDLSVMHDFAADCGNRAEWRFMIPSGCGRLTPLTVRLYGALDSDAVRLVFVRGEDAGTGDSPEVRLILRPDLESRPNHQLTKAFCGAENRFPQAVKSTKDGFVFTPDDLALTARMPGSSFAVEPEWHYMEHLPLEAYYGQDHKTDLFSPGYWSIALEVNKEAELFAAVALPGKSPSVKSCKWPEVKDIPGFAEQKQALAGAMRSFVVKRDKFHTVIAGYPWFLDWGRDTLIALRGLIRGGYKDMAADILRQFASFEEKGTIPNIIHGSTVGNRDTSDAPLWLGVAAREYVDFYKDDSILSADCSGRTFRDVLFSIALNYMNGTPNGIRVDLKSLLVFSPPHFTWMDTNYPAGTPREGYPIEIQALWYASLDFLGRYDAKFAEMAEKVRTSLEKFFFLPELGRFSDCLHCTSGVPAEKAVPDDHIRCNQLLALTLGAVRDPKMKLSVIESASMLLVPGSIRSLADREVSYRLPVCNNGHLLNDPSAPYRGRYCGPEDDSRKVAYHNGTAWGWVFPSYCEALLSVGGESQRERALAILGSVAFMADKGVPGQLPEVADGDAPHTPGGCPAQAWSVTEAFRVMDLLSAGKN